MLFSHLKAEKSSGNNFFNEKKTENYLQQWFCDCKKEREILKCLCCNFF